MEKADKRGKDAGTMSPPPSLAFTKHASSRGQSKKRDTSLKKKGSRRSRHLTNGATVVNRVPVKAVKSGGEAIATEVFKITLSTFEKMSSQTKDSTKIKKQPTKLKYVSLNVDFNILHFLGVFSIEYVYSSMDVAADINSMYLPESFKSF